MADVLPKGQTTRHLSAGVAPLKSSEATKLFEFVQTRLEAVHAWDAAVDSKFEEVFGVSFLGGDVTNRQPQVLQVSMDEGGSRVIGFGLP